MRGMILAAGRGKRMGELTESIPKPLLKVNNRYLIEYAIESLVKVGVQDIVINVSYLKDYIMDALGTGKQYGVRFHYSQEEEVLETGGGIFQALPLLGSDPFIVLSSDVITDYPLQQLPKEPKKLAHLVMVDNPDFHPHGDFGFDNDYLTCDAEKKFTFANIGIYRPELFADCQPGKFRLGDLLKKAIVAKQVTGEHYQGNWLNIGSPQQLMLHSVL